MRIFITLTLMISSLASGSAAQDLRSLGDLDCPGPGCPSNFWLHPSAVPTNSRLVQVGAFDTRDRAIADAERLIGKGFRVEEFVGEGGKFILQYAESGGKKFFRLRLGIFGELASAREFCSVLVADGENCIPVVYLPDDKNDEPEDKQFPIDKDAPPSS